MFKLSDLKNIPILNKIVVKHKKKQKIYSNDLIIRQILREIINEMVSDVIQTTKKNLKKNKILSLKDVYDAKKQLVSFSLQMQKFDNKIKSFLKRKMYFHKNVHSKTNLGRRIVTKLFTKNKKSKKFMNIAKYNSDNLERAICDYIAGMTDRYAINLYNKI